MWFSCDVKEIRDWAAGIVAIIESFHLKIIDSASETGCFVGGVAKAVLWGTEQGNGGIADIHVHTFKLRNKNRIVLSHFFAVKKSFLTSFQVSSNKF